MLKKDPRPSFVSENRFWLKFVRKFGNGSRLTSEESGFSGNILVRFIPKD